MLKEHWSKVFAAKSFDEQAADTWFRQAYPDGRGLEGLAAIPPEQWRVCKSDVKRAIAQANRSAPGPDGIPYRVWQMLGDTAADLLWKCAGELQTTEAQRHLEQAYHDDARCEFNSGLLVFLPKKPSGQDELGQPIYLACDTRPLCIVDTANRLLANAARLRWE